MARVDLREALSIPERIGAAIAGAAREHGAILGYAPGGAAQAD